MRGNKGVFCLCEDDSNGRIYFRRDGKTTWKRYKGPDSPEQRLRLTIGKRGMFCLTGNERSGTLWFRRFGAGNQWVKFRGPKP